MREIGEIIKELREKKGTQTAVAGRLKVVTSQQLGSYERGLYKPKSDFFEAWKREYGEDILSIQKGNAERNVSHETEKHTPVDKASDNNGKAAPEELYRNLVESNSEYRLVPKIILDHYEIVPKRELEEKAEIVKIALKAKDDVINQLNKEIAELRAAKTTIPTHPQHA